MFSTQNNRKTSEATLRSVISSYCCLSNLNTTSPAPKPRKCPRIPPHPGLSEPTDGSVRLSMISCDFLTSAGTSCGLEVFQGAGDIQNLTEVPRITVDASNFRSCTWWEITFVLLGTLRKQSQHMLEKRPGTSSYRNHSIPKDKLMTGTCTHET